LNIGGKIFVTSLNTLTSQRDNFFAAMFSGNFKTEPDEDGEYFIDRNPSHFQLILDHLRGIDVKSQIDSMTRLEKSQLFNEVDYYLISGLKVKEIKIVDFGDWFNPFTESTTTFTFIKNVFTKTGASNWDLFVRPRTPFTFGVNYVEFKINTISHNTGLVIGVTDQKPSTPSAYTETTAVGPYCNRERINLLREGSPKFAVNDTLGVLVDYTKDKIEFYENGVLIATSKSHKPSTHKELYPCMFVYFNATSITVVENPTIPDQDK